MRALVSVYDKAGLAALAKGLDAMGVSVLASGGTSKALGALGIDHDRVEDLTGFAELFDGRVKTLHPKIHGAILADRSKPSHRADLERLGVEGIDIVVSNLYPFSSDPSVELIDIGGPAMVRAAAKNFEHVVVLVDPADYGPVLDEIASGGTSIETRRRLAQKAFDHTSSYDARVARWLRGEEYEEADGEIDLHLHRVLPLKYGENPHQHGALYASDVDSIWEHAEWLSGPPPSYLNIFDTEAAWRLAHEVSNGPAVAIIKHANPCGVALEERILVAYVRAFDADPTSAFGGIVAFNKEVDLELAEAILARPKADVIAAPSFAMGVVELISAKRRNLRLVRLTPPRPLPLQVRSVGDAFLVQDADSVDDVSELVSVTDRDLTDEERSDVALAWKVCARTTSNAIVVVKGGSAIGIGCGQQNRVDSARIATAKAGDDARGAVAASDAFFPFPDGLETLAHSGVSVVIAPSGSIRDAEIAKRASELGISFVFAPQRHFRH